ncbi:hypothetical protein [Micropruina sp.]|uniref:hypothetical protein n=1 Tax=Micropruina sp. TaxID=2737536 RepID=UPI0039E62746
MSAENPVSPKVLASAAGAGAGASVSTLLIWVLGVTVWGQAPSASDVDQALAAVPAPVSSVIVLLVTVLASAASGWRVTDPHRITTTELMALERQRENSAPPT